MHRHLGEGHYVTYSKPGNIPVLCLTPGLLSHKSIQYSRFWSHVCMENEAGYSVSSMMVFLWSHRNQSSLYSAKHILQIISSHTLHPLWFSSGKKIVCGLANLNVQRSEQGKGYESAYWALILLVTGLGFHNSQEVRVSYLNNSRGKKSRFMRIRSVGWSQKLCFENQC